MITHRCTHAEKQSKSPVTLAPMGGQPYREVHRQWRQSNYYCYCYWTVVIVKALFQHRLCHPAMTISDFRQSCFVHSLLLNPHTVPINIVSVQALQTQAGQRLHCTKVKNAGVGGIRNQQVSHSPGSFCRQTSCTIWSYPLCKNVE